METHYPYMYLERLLYTYAASYVRKPYCAFSTRSSPSEEQLTRDLQTRRNSPAAAKTNTDQPVQSILVITGHLEPVSGMTFACVLTLGCLLFMDFLLCGF